MHEFNESLTTTFELIARLVEIAGIGLIVLGLILATGRFLMKQLAKSQDAYEDYKQSLGRSLLLGLE
ncbi:MAG: DUF1622 domain-containing protein, partial [Chitinophagaceae bacterium]|nr:DUF1622 domain-containing protein [Anaerolineae bacterium]